MVYLWELYLYTYLSDCVHFRKIDGGGGGGMFSSGKVSTYRMCVARRKCNRHQNDNSWPVLYIFVVYYTIIDFNEVDIRIYLPKKVTIHRDR